jgi:predicted amidohydrolase
VPLVEGGVVPGTDKRPPTAMTQFGKIGAAICFDMVRRLLRSTVL